MSKSRLFLISFLLTMAVMLALIYRDHAPRAPELVRVTGDVYVTSQLTSENIQARQMRRFRTIVDIRPDGEAADQAPSSEIEVAAKSFGKAFHYIPVPHESIPDEAVDALVGVLSHDATPVVLYCRSGRRAVRTFALATASQAGGPDAKAILEMVERTGFSVEDLKSNIADRIARPGNAATVEK